MMKTSRLLSAVSKGALISCSLLTLAFATSAHSAGLPERIDKLESTQTILTKISEYSAGIDDVIRDENPQDAANAYIDRFCSQFVVNYGNFGSYNNKTDLYNFLVGAIAPAYSWGYHSTLNPRVYVDGNLATSQFYLLAYAVPTGTMVNQIFFGKYEIDWKRLKSGDWCISQIDLSFDEVPTP